MKITLKRVLAISLPVIFYLGFTTSCHDPYGDGVRFSQKIETICQQQQGIAIVSLDNILKQPWDKLYMFVGEYGSNEHIAHKIGDDSYFTFLDADPYQVRRIVVTHQDKIQSYFDLPWVESGDYDRRVLRVHLYINYNDKEKAFMMTKEKAVFIVEQDTNSWEKWVLPEIDEKKFPKQIDIEMHTIGADLVPENFARRPTYKKEAIKAALWKVYPDSMKKYGHLLK